MPVKEYIIEEKKVNQRIYKKKYAICICDFCQKEWKAERWQKKENYTFCSKKCTYESRKKNNFLEQKIKKTNQDKYGVEYVLQNKKIFEKRKKSILEKYGVESIQDTERWKESRKKTILEKYGDEFFRTEEFKNLRKKTLLEKYGVDSPLKNEDFLIKRNKTKEENFKDLNKKQEFVDKMFKTNIEKYGYKTSFELEEVQDKCYLSCHGYTREEYLENLNIYKIYRNEVRRITENQNLKNLENYDKRGKETYHLDHIYSISDGFRNNIDATIVGSIVNLRFIEAEKNRHKTNKSEISIEELYRRYNDLSK